MKYDRMRKIRKQNKQSFSFPNILFYLLATILFYLTVDIFNDIAYSIVDFAQQNTKHPLLYIFYHNPNTYYVICVFNFIWLIKFITEKNQWWTFIYWFIMWWNKNLKSFCRIETFALAVEFYIMSESSESEWAPLG